MKCPSCGKENPEDAQYCNGCGKTLISKEAKWKVWYKKKAVIFSAIGILVVIAVAWLLLPSSGSNYKTVKIGDQTWMKENLNVDHYRNGDVIPEVQEGEWSNLTTGAWCYYNYDPANGKKYGKLYNWYAVNDPRGLAPKGWHIPTLKEFETLVATVHQDGNALKAVGQGYGNGVGTNTSGFSALLAGCRFSSIHFGRLGYVAAFFWSSTEDSTDIAYSFGLSNNGSDVSLFGIGKEYGFSVRCVKD